jgi:hypothetical protein
LSGWRNDPEQHRHRRWQCLNGIPRPHRRWSGSPGHA